jgi:hypothetical protein
MHLDAEYMAHSNTPTAVMTFFPTSHHRKFERHFQHADIDMTKIQGDYLIAHDLRMQDAITTLRDMDICSPPPAHTVPANLPMPRKGIVAAMRRSTAPRQYWHADTIPLAPNWQKVKHALILVDVFTRQCFVKLLKERERERSLLDKLRGVPTCQRCRRWPSDVTAALFFSVCACVSMLYIYYTSLPPLPSLPDPPCSPPPDSTALNTLCIPSILAVMHRRMILFCLPFSIPSVVRLHLQLCSTIVPCIPMMKFSCFTWYPE